MVDDKDDKAIVEEDPTKITSAGNRIGTPEDQDSKTVIGQVFTPMNLSQEQLPLEALAPTGDPSWPLQQYFDGQINLDVELSQRFKNVPVLTSTKFRTLGDQKEHGVATIAAPDDSSWVVFDADKISHVVRVSFTLSGMLSLQFTLEGLNDLDRARWIALMRREEGGLAFLWGPRRWEHDYFICIKRKYFTNIFAFSPGQFEAAARLTPEATQKWVDWLEKFWQTESVDGNDELPPILTW
jgi:hypothetical protein